MNKSVFFQNIKLTVFIGYFLLFLLAVLGGYKIYNQLITFSRKEQPFTERKQLSLISNALVSMYETESMRKIILTDNVNIANLDLIYKNQNQKIHSYLDTLYRATNQKEIRRSLDTVNLLLNAKEINLKNMLLLSDSIKNLPYSKKILTTILSKNDINDLYDIFEQKFSKRTNDSSFYEKKKKKGFFAKLKDVFNEDQDSSKVTTKQSTTTSDTSYVKPAQLLTDTIVQFVNDVSKRSDRKKAIYLTKLSLRQDQMLYYDEMLTTQVHQILRNLEAKERKIANSLIFEREKTVRHSSQTVSFIALASLFVILFFMFWTLRLINKSQDYKNKLEKSKQYAEDLLISRERLLLMISHDIKSPLSSILGHIELLSKEKMPENEKNYINTMRNSSEHILELVNRLMDYHKLEQGKSEKNIVQFSPCMLVDDIYKEFVPIVAKKELKFILNNNVEKQQLFENDPYILKQIINNLISNATKFTQKGIITFSSSIVNNELLQISIKDTGIGIKEQDKEKIFNEFQRVGNAQEQNSIEGYGLGLAITQKLVKLLDGGIKLNSEYGKGSEFTIEIPINKSENQIQPSNKNIAQTHTPKLSAKVLFVDDDEAMLNVYKKLLTQEGAEVTVCSNPKNVSLLLEKTKFDIMLTDIQMPQMNGFELIKSIRTKNKDYYSKLPVIALSARSDISEENFITEGFTAFLSKPVPFNVLINKILDLVNLEISKIKNTAEISQSAEKGIHSIIEFVKDDQETSLDILNVFIDENNLKINQLSNFLKNKNWEQIKMVAHKLLPLMRMIGAQEIIEICETLEIGEKDTTKVKTLIDLVKNKNKEIEEFIKINLS